MRRGVGTGTDVSEEKIIIDRLNFQKKILQNSLMLKALMIEYAEKAIKDNVDISNKNSIASEENSVNIFTLAKTGAIHHIKKEMKRTKISENILPRKVKVSTVIFVVSSVKRKLPLKSILIPNIEASQV